MNILTMVGCSYALFLLKRDILRARPYLTVYSVFQYTVTTMTLDYIVATINIDACDTMFALQINKLGSAVDVKARDEEFQCTPKTTRLQACYFSVTYINNMAFV